MAKADYQILSTLTALGKPLGEKQDVVLIPSDEPVSIEESYGDNLVAHGLARKIEKPVKRSRANGSAAPDRSTAGLEAAEARVRVAEQALADAADGDAKSAAQAALDAANSDVDALLAG